MRFPFYTSNEGEWREVANAKRCKNQVVDHGAVFDIATWLDPHLTKEGGFGGMLSNLVRCNCPFYLRDDLKAIISLTVQLMFKSDGEGSSARLLVGYHSQRHVVEAEGQRKTWVANSALLEELRTTISHSNTL